MSSTDRPMVRDVRAQAFDVICAGDALPNIDEGATFRPGGGAIDAALSLAAQGLRVGLATVLADDTSTRVLLEKVAASGIDVGGVERASRASGLVFIRGGARQVISSREEEQPISVPATWSSEVLLLSGMSPVVSHAGALCKAARAGRRAGTIVVLDLHARWDLWQGRDPRALRMVVREADVVCCDAQDLLGLRVDLPTLRSSMRRGAVLVSSDGVTHALASGPFGEIAHVWEREATPAPFAEGHVFTAAICSELALARAAHTDERSGALWKRALARAHPTRLR